MNLIANRLICGWCHLVHINLKTCGRRNHSVCMIWPSLENWSATTFGWPGMCRALRVPCYLEHRVRIHHNRAHSGPNLVPTSLFM